LTEGASLRIFIYIFLLLNPFYANSLPLNDNILFAFEKCKTLSVNLAKGQLNEALTPSFDIHCKKNKNLKEFICDFFSMDSNKKIKEEVFWGESELGIAELRNKKGSILKFLIGRKFASFESPSESTMCIGFYLFEKDALKQKR
jgi:hypothetical protein